MRCLTVESGNLSIVNNSLKDGHSSKYWENIGETLGWAGICGARWVMGKKFVLGWEWGKQYWASTGPALVAPSLESVQVVKNMLICNKIWDLVQVRTKFRVQKIL